MYRRLQPLKTVSREILRPYIQQIFKFDSTQTNNHYSLYYLLLHNILSPVLPCRNFYIERRPNLNNDFNQSAVDSPQASESDDPVSANDAATVQQLLKFYVDSSAEELEQALNQCGFLLSEDLVIQVLRRHRSDWKSAFLFFNWVSKGGGVGDYIPGSGAYNEILDVLGRLKRFQLLGQVLDEMSNREGVISERTYAILLNRYAADHRVEEAINIFYKRRHFGLELDLIAFQTLLMCLCRYKHVEAAEFLFHSKQNEFPPVIKTRNIILNGWCVRGNLREAKRFWNDIISSKCKPDLFTYGTFINSLTKAGKLSTAVKLFNSMWEKGCTPDVAICNCIIDALCFKKRIPDALEIFGEMNERGCLPDVATYNSLIKHLCNIQRMEKVYELLDEMEAKCCMPNARTYNYLLKSMKKPEEVPQLLERMERSGCRITGDTYNLILKLFMHWNRPERVTWTWVEMERNGVGPDQRSYTIMIHGLYSYGRMEEALHYFTEMTSKGMIPEPRTKLLVKAINIKVQEREGEQGVGATVEDSFSNSVKSEKKKRTVNASSTFKFSKDEEIW